MSEPVKPSACLSFYGNIIMVLQSLALKQYYVLPYIPALHAACKYSGIYYGVYSVSPIKAICIYMIINHVSNIVA